MLILNYTLYHRHKSQRNVFVSQNKNMFKPKSVENEDICLEIGFVAIKFDFTNYWAELEFCYCSMIMTA